MKGRYFGSCYLGVIFVCVIVWFGDHLFVVCIAFQFSCWCSRFMGLDGVSLLLGGCFYLEYMWICACLSGVGFNGIFW